MAKFNPILMQKVEEERREAAKQQKLKEDAGIETEDIVVKPKGMKDYMRSVLRTVVYVCFIIAIFIGLITLLNPESRQIIFSVFS